MEKRKEALKWWREMGEHHRINLLWKWREKTKHPKRFWSFPMINITDWLIEDIYKELFDDKERENNDSHCYPCVYIPISGDNARNKALSPITTD